MVKIRLKRQGAKKAPFYRVVVADSRSPRDGRNIEQLGTYDPMTNPASVKIDLERARYWISCGAQPTDTVRGLLKRAQAEADKAAEAQAAEAAKAAEVTEAEAAPEPAPAEAAE